MRKLSLGTLIVAVVITTMACGRDETPATVQAPPTFEPLPIPTIPADFVAFTDESKRFSISYPSHWELALSLTEELDEFVAELLESLESDVPLPEGSGVFFAGVPTQEGYDPNIVIVVEALPYDVGVAEYFEAVNKAEREFLTDYKLHTKAVVLLGDKEGIMTDAEYYYSPSLDPRVTPKWRSFDLNTVDGLIGWGVGCGMTLPASPQDLETCESVVRSFRLLQ